jgi:CheY-like chemotaxis protein
MTITCPSCHATLTIPDDRLPRGKVIGASCPHCKGRVVIDTTGPAPEPAPTPAPAPVAPIESSPAGYGEAELPAALLCVAALAEQKSIAATLKQEGYRVQVARDAADAIDRLRFTAYALLILREGFGSPKGEANPLLDHLASMEMADRRRLHVVLVSPTLRSHDPAAAFARSVTLVLHLNDLPHLATALKRMRGEVDETYQVYLESLRSAGKA